MAKKFLLFLVLLLFLIIPADIKANPTTPQQTNFLTNASSLNQPRDIIIKNSYAYIVSYTGSSLTTFSLSNPASPSQTSYYTNVTSILNPFGLVNINNYIYVTNYGGNSLTTFSLSNPASPSQTSYYTNATSLNASYAAAGSDLYLYVISYNGDSLTTFSLSNPASPSQIAFLTNITSLDHPTDILINNNYLYITSYTGNSLTTFSLSNPASPSQIAFYSNATSLNRPTSISLSNNYLYITSYTGNSLTTFSLSNPASPSQTSYYTNATSLLNARRITSTNNYSYVASYSGTSLTTFSLSNPDIPSLTDLYINATSLSLPSGIATAKGYLYLVSYAGKSITTFFLFKNIGKPIIISPANLSFINTAPSVEYIIVDNDTATLNCKLYIDGKINMTNSSVSNNTNSFFYPALLEGYHPLYINCTDNDSTEISSQYYIYYDSSEPVINLQTPSYLNNTIFDQNIHIIGNITDNSLYRANLTITTPNGSTLYNNYSGNLPANTTFYSLTKTISSYLLPEGTYNFFLEAVDSHTGFTFDEKPIVTEIEKDAKYEIILSKDSPDFEITSDMKMGFVQASDRINFKFTTLKPERKSFIFKTEEPLVEIVGSEYPCHYVFGKYWFDCEGLDNPSSELLDPHTLKIEFDMLSETAGDELGTPLEATAKSLGGLNENNLSLTFEVNHTCFPVWIESYSACLINDSMQLSYDDTNDCGIPLNLPADNGSWWSCNYCSADIVNTTTSACYHNSSFDYQNISYYDNNYFSCCAVTSLFSDCLIDYAPFNTTYFQRCYLTTEQFSVQYDEHADFGLGNDKIFWAINLNDSNNNYKCTSYIITEDGRLIQTNPVYTQQSDTLIKIRDTNYEDREFFNIENGIGNIYFTKENLVFDGRDYVFGVQCAGNNQTIKSEKWVVVGYENINAPTTRFIWAQGQMQPIILGIIILIIIIITIVIIIKIWKGR